MYDKVYETKNKTEIIKLLSGKLSENWNLKISDFNEDFFYVAYEKKSNSDIIGLEKGYEHTPYYLVGLENLFSIKGCGRTLDLAFEDFLKKIKEEQDFNKSKVEEYENILQMLNEKEKKT